VVRVIGSRRVSEELLKWLSASADASKVDGHGNNVGLFVGHFACGAQS
jgi:hypothetical protein